MAPKEIDADLISEDIREFIVLLERHGVRWMLVGGHAAIFHGNIRVTGNGGCQSGIGDRAGCRHRQGDLLAKQAGGGAAEGSR